LQREELEEVKEDKDDFIMMSYVLLRASSGSNYGLKKFMGDKEKRSKRCGIDHNLKGNASIG
jgi:hypothetical protein